jgi:hypothetical protein
MSGNGSSRGIIDFSNATFTDRLNDQPVAVPMDDRFVAGRTRNNLTCRWPPITPPNMAPRSLDKSHGTAPGIEPRGLSVL